MIVTPLSALTQFLGDLLADADVAGCLVKLFQNNHAPTEGDVLADYTEASFVGYASKPANFGGTGVVIDPQGNPSIVGVNATFIAGAITGPQTLYGYYVVNAAGTKLLWAEQFQNPIQITAAGQIIGVVPTYALAIANLDLPI